VHRRTMLRTTNGVNRLGLFAATLCVSFIPLALSGCNTTEGVGEDIEAAGDAIEDAADDAND